jgi:hypothetical protein
MATGVFKAKVPFSTDVNGVPKSVLRGELYSGKNPLVRANPHLFEEVTFGDASGVEQATKAPSEKRETSPAAKKPKGK